MSDEEECHVSRNICDDCYYNLLWDSYILLTSLLMGDGAEDTFSRPAENPGKNISRRGSTVIIAQARSA